MFWALKKCILDDELTEKYQRLKINELDEWRTNAYENSLRFKLKSKSWHDKHLKKTKELQPEDKVLIFNSRLRLFPRKLKSYWTGPFVVTLSPFMGHAKY